MAFSKNLFVRDDSLAGFENPSSLRQLIMRGIINNFCFPGLVVLAILNVLYYVFTNLDKVREWPGFSTLNALFTRNPFTKVGPNLVSHFRSP